MSSTTLTLHPVENAAAYGCPYHGEVKQSGGDLLLYLPNGETRETSTYGVPFYIKHPSPPTISRSDIEAAEDTRLGRQWRDYVLLSPYGKRFGGCVTLELPRYLVVDEANVTWIVRIDAPKDAGYNKTIELWLDGTFGRTSGGTCSIKLATLTLSYWLSVDSTAFSDVIAVAPSPDGRNWFINCYETRASNIGTFWAANCLTDVFYFGGAQSQSKILRDVFKIAFSGTGALSGSIGEGISADTTHYKTYTQTFTSTTVTGDAFPGHCEECAETPYDYPVGNCDECQSSSDSDSGASSYDSTATLGYWYDSDGTEQTGTITYEEDYSWSTSSSISKTCDEGTNTCTVTSITCEASVSKTMTRTITLPGHTETQTSVYTEDSDCSGVVVLGGLANGPWGTINSTVPTNPFGEYCLDGAAGMHWSWTSTRGYGSTAHITVDLYGNKATSTKVGVILHPLTGAGDNDTEGWI